MGSPIYALSSDKPWAELTPEEQEAERHRLKEMAVGYAGLNPPAAQEDPSRSLGFGDVLAGAAAPALLPLAPVLGPLSALTGITPAEMGTEAARRLLQTPLARAGARFAGATAEEAAGIGGAIPPTGIGERFAQSRLGGALSELVPGGVARPPAAAAVADLTEEQLKRRFAVPSSPVVPAPSTAAAAEPAQPRQMITSRIENGRVVFTNVPVEGGGGEEAARKSYESGLAEFAARRMSEPRMMTTPVGGGFPASFQGGAGPGAFSPSRAIPGLGQTFEQVAAAESPAVQEEWLRRKALEQATQTQDLQSRIQAAQAQTAEEQLRRLTHSEVAVQEQQLLVQTARQNLLQDPLVQALVTAEVRAAEGEAKKRGLPWNQEAFDLAYALAQEKVVTPRLDMELRRIAVSDPRVAAQAYGGMFRGGF